MKTGKSAHLVLVAALGSLALLAACAQPAPTSVPATTAPVVNRAAPAATTAPVAKGPTGTLTIALSMVSDETFLPWNGQTMRNAYLDPIYEFLIYLDPKTLTPKPGLALKWDMSPDGKTWTFYLRQGVQFQEGWGELTSEDVKYTVERMLDPKSTMSGAAQLRSEIASIDAPDKYKVVFNLKAPDVDFATGIMSDTNQIVIASKKYVESVGDAKANAHPIGTGPYTLAEEHQQGGPIKLKAVPGSENHWRVSPAFQYITFLIVPEEATRVAMLKSGAVDLAPISYDSVDSIKAVAGLHIASIPFSWAPVIRFGGLIEGDPVRYKPDNPWAKVEVRQALNYAVDKEAIVKNIFHGEGTIVGADTPYPEWLDIPGYPYDVAKAKQLLASAGYPNGFPITVKSYTVQPGAELPTIAEAVAMYWKAIGVDVTIDPTDYGAVSADWTGGKGKADGYAFVHRGMSFASPLMGLFITNDVKSNFATYQDKSTDAKLAAIRSQFDLSKRSALIKDLGQYLRDQAVYVFIAFANEPYGASNKVGNWPTPSVRPQAIEYITPLTQQ